MDIFVYADWKGLSGPTMIGTLHVARTKGHGVFSFEYNKEWIKNGKAQDLDPDLQFYAGPQYLAKDKPNFGVFMDSSPDRWGKELMRRREAILARQQERKARTLFEEDYLLGVYDLHRMGGLRFKISGNDNFQQEDQCLAAPPWTSLRELEHASQEFENDMLQDQQALHWINMLIAPGASLGGARPKASVTDEKGHLWIAKFPSVKDTANVGAWEMLVAELAAESKINTAHGIIKRFNSKYDTFLSKRFDRTKEGRRLHFASAMTLLSKTDGADALTGVSYLDLVQFIMEKGAAPNADLEQLWRRIVFSIAIKSTDDHLRNHGFLLTESGWQLSPAYDINPIYFGTGLSLNISSDDNSLDFDLALSVAGYFRVTSSQAKDIIIRTKKTVSKWRQLANKYQIPRQEQEQMSAAFELAMM
ncbi:HipA domain-containing protein [Flavitalea sp. BT771]|uniref:type II toxin-antitoxin system HipA family toxin n=1 Tax=Flavitalea sp. BT771 TaxID=3063329 RepID=UPI0026E183BC|nr:HipA domain-containing protein [Flavitalea sp. BT771]MDO6433488.1 HipA domain-containing protein [Flavitalea sp. BT771]MDV6222607.1 HipA domain-containing protein [Flavitalea sp. BT771]